MECVGFGMEGQVTVRMRRLVLSRAEHQVALHALVRLLLEGKLVRRMAHQIVRIAFPRTDKLTSDSSLAR